MDSATKTAEIQELGAKIGSLLQKRLNTAAEAYKVRVQTACKKAADSAAHVSWAEPYYYTIDFVQRSILFWDALRQRGNDYVARAQQDSAPVLKFQYETIADARKFAKPVNYALVSIVPPAGVRVDAKRRPYVIIDPRAGHGPGIAGFKDDSEVGVALAAGHPVYFVMFFQHPEPGQTLLDVCEAEKAFVRIVRERHPGSPKPVILGNCQGGWAAAMLAAADPDDMGPVILIGSPMSYWGGAWHEEQAPNPMRYAGGLLGGTWLSSLAADLGNGLFDGAYLVENFEYLNPANTYWDKYYKVFANADTEPERFVEFERWWATYYLMNRAEIEWITRNLFIGNKLWSGEVKQKSGKAFDLRDIKSPIILFASLGDNITPPQQAFNWVADVFRTTEEIKAGGHVIVGLVHEDAGHLGIFVSGKVAQKETRKLVEVMEAIELLQPGIYGMEFTERAGADGKSDYDIQFREYRLEEITAKLNPRQRQDERPFEAVLTISEFNQRAYELFMRPVTKAVANEWTARLLRHFHPLRARNWLISDAINPALAWLGPATQAVKAQRLTAPGDGALRKTEAIGAELVSAALDHYRAVRDALAEAAFFTIYGNVYVGYLADQPLASQDASETSADPRQRPIVQQALARIKEGGYPEAFARVGFLLAGTDKPVPLSLLTTAQDLIKDYADLMPALPMDEWRRIRGKQEIIVRYDPERAIETLPQLLDDEERKRLLALIERVVSDRRVVERKPTAQQASMLDQIRKTLGGERMDTAADSRDRTRAGIQRRRTRRAGAARGRASKDSLHTA
jgi:pimeloyl-ACP methyl ester carboxylesterase